MQFNLDLPYRKLPGDVKTAPELTRIIITQMVAIKYKDSIPRTESKMWAKIQDEFAENKDKIDIDGTQFDFLYDLIDKVDMPPNFSSWLETLREAMRKEKEKPKQAVKSA